MGFAQLQALAASDMLDPAQQLFIDAALAAVVREPVEEITATGDADIALLNQDRQSLVAADSADEPLAPEHRDEQDGSRP